MTEAINENAIWEDSKKKVWIEESFGMLRLSFTTKGTNASQGIYLEDAEAIYNAVAYFKNSGIWEEVTNGED